MTFIGTTPKQGFTSHIAPQSFSSSVNGTTTVFTLSNPVASENDLEVFVGNVRQEPGSGKAYTATGTALTFTEAPALGLDVYVNYKGQAQITSIPQPNSSITTPTITNGMYVTGALPSLTVDKGGIDRSGNTTRIVSGRAGGNYADLEVHIAGVSGINKQLTMDYLGNTSLHNGSLTIDTIGKHLGVGTNNPSHAIQVHHTAPEIMLEETTTGGSKRISMGVTNSGTPFISAEQSGGLIDFFCAGAHTARINSTGGIFQNPTSSAELMLKANVSSGSGTPQFSMFKGSTRYAFVEAGVNNTATGTGNHMVILTEQGDLFAKDSGGNSTQLSPHNFDYIPNGESETGAWCYRSENLDTEIIKDEEGKKTGEKVKSATFISADMTKVVRQVEKLTGEKLIYKGTLDIKEDGTVNKHNDDGSKVKDNIIADLIKRIEALESK